MIVTNDENDSYTERILLMIVNQTFINKYAILTASNAVNYNF